MRDAVNALMLSEKTKPELAVFVGDVVHNALDASTDYDWFARHRSGLDVAAELFAGFFMPVHFLWGESVSRRSPTSLCQEGHPRLEGAALPIACQACARQGSVLGRRGRVG